MQKYGDCEICGEYSLVADYGYNKEYVCVQCSLDDDKLSEHITKEMIRRHGREKMQRIVRQVNEIAGITSPETLH